MYLEKEIKEQPKVLQKIFEHEWKNIETVASELKRANARGLYFVARGSSDNAALYAKYLFGIRNRMLTSLAAPSILTVYHRPPNLSGFATVAVSQSGEGPDVIAIVENAIKQGVLTIALTNNAKSSLAKISDFVIDLCAGEERSVAATKTYTAQLFCLAVLSHFMNSTGRGMNELAAMPEIVDSILAGETGVAEVASHYRGMDRCIVLSRGFNYATSHELALKLKELCYVLAEPYSSVDFMHGPIALLEGGFPVILIAPRARVNSGLFQLAKNLREKLAEVLAISDDCKINALATKKIELSRSAPEWLSPISSIVAGQLFCLHLALKKGMQPDRPRGLKKVTKTF